MKISMSQFLGLRRSGALERFHRKLNSGVIFGITRQISENPERRLMHRHSIKGKHKKKARKFHRELIARAEFALANEKLQGDNNARTPENNQGSLQGPETGSGV